jgi:hypothetical protein
MGARGAGRARRGRTTITISRSADPEQSDGPAHQHLQVPLPPDAGKQLLGAFQDQHWADGKTPWGQRKIEFWQRLKGRYDDFLAGRGGVATDSEETAEEQTFAAEADLRNFLANNLDCVEPGLRLYQKGETNGVEFAVDDGRIDILATDRVDRFVVFEFKADARPEPGRSGRSSTTGWGRQAPGAWSVPKHHRRQGDYRRPDSCNAARSRRVAVSLQRGGRTLDPHVARTLRNCRDLGKPFTNPRVAPSSCSGARLRES